MRRRRREDMTIDEPMAVITPALYSVLALCPFEVAFEWTIRRSRWVQCGVQPVQGDFILGLAGAQSCAFWGVAPFPASNLMYTTLPLPAPNPLLTNPAKGFTPSLQHQSFCFVWRVACSGADKVS